MLCFRHVSFTEAQKGLILSLAWARRPSGFRSSSVKKLCREWESEQAGRKFWTIASRLDRKPFSLTQSNHAEVSVARQIRDPRRNPAPSGTLSLCHKSGFVIDITDDQTAGGGYRHQWR